MNDDELNEQIMEIYRNGDKATKYAILSELYLALSEQEKEAQRPARRPKFRLIKGGRHEPKPEALKGGPTL